MGLLVTPGRSTDQRSLPVPASMQWPWMSAEYRRSSPVLGAKVVRKSFSPVPAMPDWPALGRGVRQAMFWLRATDQAVGAAR